MSDEFVAAFEDTWFRQHARWSDSHDLNGAIAFSNERVRILFCQRAARVRVEESDAGRLIDDAVRFFAGKDFDCTFTLSPLDRPANFAEHLLRRGFVESTLSSAMVYDAGAPPAAVQAGATLTLAGPDDYDAWAEVMCRSFEQPSQKGDFGRRVLMTPADHRYLARVDGKAVGSTLLLSQEGMGYLDFVGVLREYRRRGVASAMVTRAVADSIGMGNRWTSLETATGSSAERLYESLGFRTAYHRSRFIKVR